MSCFQPFPPAAAAPTAGALAGWMANTNPAAPHPGVAAGSGVLAAPSNQAG